MPIPVSIPTPLRPLTDNLDTVEVDGSTVGEVIMSLDKRFPGIAARLHDSNGNLHRGVGVFVDGEDIRFLQEKNTPVKPTSEVVIVPAFAGG